jgi:hypothetical protein
MVFFATRENHHSQRSVKGIMNRRYTILLTLILAGCTGEQPIIPNASPAISPNTDTVPQLFRSDEFNSRMIAESANYFIGIGEEKAIEELLQLTPSDDEPFGRKNTKNGVRLDRNRAAWMLRILYLPKQRYIRQPLFGGLSLPRETMSLDDWPLYPLAESEDVYFVLSDGYMLAGVAERISDYAAHCKENGTFRKKKVTVPTSESAKKALSSLYSSQRWKKIEWTHKSPSQSYQIAPKIVTKYLDRQTNIQTQN